MISSRKGTFDTEDNSRVKHSRIGVWDLYEEITPRLIAWPTLHPLFDVIENIPYVWHMILDITSIRECNVLLLAYLVIELVASLIPALSLWSVLLKYFFTSHPSSLIQVLRTAAAYRVFYSRLSPSY